VNFRFANGSVKITSAPGGATVLQAGRELGRTPLLIEEVKPGAVAYELRLAGYKNGTVTGAVQSTNRPFSPRVWKRNSARSPVSRGSIRSGCASCRLAVIPHRIRVHPSRVENRFCSASGRRG